MLIHIYIPVQVVLQALFCFVHSWLFKKTLYKTLQKPFRDKNISYSPLVQDDITSLPLPSLPPTTASPPHKPDFPVMTYTPPFPLPASVTTSINNPPTYTSPTSSSPPPPAYFPPSRSPSPQPPTYRPRHQDAHPNTSWTRFPSSERPHRSKTRSANDQSHLHNARSRRNPSRSYRSKHHNSSIQPDVHVTSHPRSSSGSRSPSPSGHPYPPTHNLTHNPLATETCLDLELESGYKAGQPMNRYNELASEEELLMEEQASRNRRGGWGEYRGGGGVYGGDGGCLERGGGGGCLGRGSPNGVVGRRKGVVMLVVFVVLVGMIVPGVVLRVKAHSVVD